MTPEQIRELRHRLGLTQGQFADKIGASVSTVQNAERGYAIRPRTLANIKRLSQTPMPVYPSAYSHPVSAPSPDLESLLVAEPVADAPPDDDVLVLYTRAQQALVALYRAVKSRQTSAPADSSPRSARLSPTEIAQRQVDTKAERRRLSEERIAAATVQWNADALAKVQDCAQRWPFLSHADILMEIENLRNTPVLGEHQRLLDFIDVYIYTRRPASPAVAEDAHLFAPGEYRSSGRLFITPMPQ